MTRTCLPAQITIYFFLCISPKQAMAMELKDFKAAFDRICHAALWTIMRKYNINANLVCVFESLYEKATRLSAVQLNGTRIVQNNI